MSVGGLTILRQINPSQDLYNALAKLEQLYEFQDGSIWWDDSQPTEPEFANEIIGSTFRWGLFDAEWNLLARYSALDKAEKALAAARPVIKTEIELDGGEEPTAEVDD